MSSKLLLLLSSANSGSIEPTNPLPPSILFVRSENDELTISSTDFSASSLNTKKIAFAFSFKLTSYGVSVLFSKYNQNYSQSSWHCIARRNLLDFYIFVGGALHLVTFDGVFTEGQFSSILLSVDTTQAVAANRIKLEVNGVPKSPISASYPSQNADFNVNSTVPIRVGNGVF